MRSDFAQLLLPLAVLLGAQSLAQGIQVTQVPPAKDGGPTGWVMIPFPYEVADHVGRLSVELIELNSPHGDLYLRQGAPPTRFAFDHKASTQGTTDELLVVDASTSPALSSGTWYAGVWVPQGANFQIQADLAVLPSERPGIGAIPFGSNPEDPSGTTFRVWAPNADSVHVAGSFNAWSSSKMGLASEPAGLWSVDVRDVVAGDQYRFVIRNGSQTLWKNDPRALSLTNSSGNSIVYDQDAYDWQTTGYTTPSWDDMVIYEMHVGTFNDPAVGGPVGDFAAVAARLPYLKDLGVTAIELMPTGEFAGDYSWGYNYGHPFSTESAYGGADGLKALVDAAHSQGIAVLLDLVNNHWGPSDLDLWRLDGWSQGPWGGIYFYNDGRAVTPWGDTRPDFGRSEVRQYLRDNNQMWLERFRVDGMRWDSTSNIRRTDLGDNPDGWSLMQWANDEVDGTQPWKLMIAEDLSGAPNEFITRPTSQGGAGFDTQWDALFVHPVRAAVETPDDNARNMFDVRNAIAQSYNGNAFQRVIYTESHDEVANGRSRVPEEIWPGQADSYYSKKRSTLAAALVFTAPGIPMLFQGQELLEDGYFTDTDPLDWTKLVTFAGIHQMYRDMIGLRRNLSGTTAGLRGQNTNVHLVDNTNKVVAFHRWDQGGPLDDVIVLANFRNQSWNNYRVGLPRAGTWRVRLNTDWSGYDASFMDTPSADVTAQAVSWNGMPYSAELTFGPYTALVLSQD